MVVGQAVQRPAGSACCSGGPAGPYGSVPPGLPAGVVVLVKGRPTLQAALSHRDRRDALRPPLVVMTDSHEPNPVRDRIVFPGATVDLAAWCD